MCLLAAFVGAAGAKLALCSLPRPHFPDLDVEVCSLQFDLAERMKDDSLKS